MFGQLETNYRTSIHWSRLLVPILLRLQRPGLTVEYLIMKFFPRGYSILRRDRLGRSGGVVLLACRDDIVCIRKSDLELNGCEFIWCELACASGSKFLFGVFYRPPDTKSDYMDLVAESFNRISRLNIEKVFLVGDFNLPHFDWVNQLPLQYDQLHINTFELLNDLFLTQLNHQAVRHNNILDLVFTTHPNLIGNVTVTDSLVISDHLNVNFNIKLKVNPAAPRPKCVFD